MNRAIICILVAAVSLSNWICPAFSASTDSIVTEAVINAPVADVWREWTTKDGIESWMVAKTEIDHVLVGSGGQATAELQTLTMTNRCVISSFLTIH